MEAEEIGTTTLYLQCPINTIIPFDFSKDLSEAKLKYCSQRQRRTSPFFFFSSSSGFLAFHWELIASELRLFSHGPLVHLILTRWRASDDGTVKCASGEEENTYKKIQFEHLKRSHLLSEGKRGLIASGSAATAGKLNKRCHTVALPCRFMSVEASEQCTQLGVAPAWPGTARQRAVRSCPLKCSCIIFFTSSAAG